MMDWMISHVADSAKLWDLLTCSVTLAPGLECLVHGLVSQVQLALLQCPVLASSVTAMAGRHSSASAP